MDAHTSGAVRDLGDEVTLLDTQMGGYDGITAALPDPLRSPSAGGDRRRPAAGPSSRNWPPSASVRTTSPPSWSPISTSITPAVSATSRRPFRRPRSSSTSAGRATWFPPSGCSPALGGSTARCSTPFSASSSPRRSSASGRWATPVWSTSAADGDSPAPGPRTRLSSRGPARLAHGRPLRRRCRRNLRAQRPIWFSRRLPHRTLTCRSRWRASRPSVTSSRRGCCLATSGR